MIFLKLLAEYLKFCNFQLEKEKEKVCINHI